MMRGIEKALSNTGCPWPGGAEVEFHQADVVQLGKLYCWGSAGCQYVVRLRDGREVFVRADRQAKEDERFLRRLAKPVRGWAPGRAEGFRTVWSDRNIAPEKITLDTIRALNAIDNPKICEGEGRNEIVVWCHGGSGHIAKRYTVKRGIGKVSLVDSPEQAMTHVLRRRGVR